MQLKEYQRRALETIRSYLELLADWRKKAEDNPDLEIDFPAKAWEKAGMAPACAATAGRRRYLPRKNGLGQPLPTFCMKVPTGGGKTLLAVKTVDLGGQDSLGRSQPETGHSVDAFRVRGERR